MSRILGIDPGSSTGCAIYQDGKLTELWTTQPHLIAGIIAAQKPSRVVYEDSRLTSFVFTQVKSRDAALKMARNVGEIDAWSCLIASVCADAGIACHGISPKNKGAKLDAVQFKALTGWEHKTNSHVRDAAMVAWPYRRAA